MAQHPYGELLTAKDFRLQIAGIAIAALSAPLVLNGFYNSILAKNPPFYWGVEVMTWILWPGLWFFILHRYGVVFADLGVAFPSPSYRKILRLAAVVVLLLPLWFVFDGIVGILCDLLFPENRFDQGFRYPSQLPDHGIWRFLIAVYFAASAGVVEEIVFRSLPRLVSNNTRLSLAFYILWSSLLFSLAHWENGQRAMAFTFTWGASMAALFLVTRSLWPGIIIHFLTDFSGFYFRFSMEQWLLRLLQAIGGGTSAN